MTKSKPIELTTEEVRTLWDYRDGELFWKKSGKGRKMDRPAGCFGADGYRKMSLNGRYYKVHRLIWLWHDRELIDGLVIDHIDTNRVNNRIENLQQISQSENYRRSERVKKPKGCVSFLKQSNKWHVCIGKNYKNIYLGLFQTREEAVEYLENYRNEQARSDSSTSDGAGRKVAASYQNN